MILFHLGSCVGLKVSFSDLSESSIGIRGIGLGGLFRPDSPSFVLRGIFFGPRGLSIGLRLLERSLCWQRGFCVGLRDRLVGMRVSSFRSYSVTL